MENTTMTLIDRLVDKHKLDKEKVIRYIIENGDKGRSFKLFLSGFMHDLSMNKLKYLRR